MFDIERYLIIANIFICVALAIGLGFHQRYLDQQQTKTLTQQTTIAANQHNVHNIALLQKIADVERQQTILLNSIVDIQNTVSGNHIADQAEASSILNTIKRNQ